MVNVELNRSGAGRNASRPPAVMMFCAALVTQQTCGAAKVGAWWVGALVGDVLLSHR